jgi:hypothetical protein
LNCGPAGHRKSLGIALDVKFNHIVFLFGFQNFIAAGSGPGWKIR